MVQQVTQDTIVAALSSGFGAAMGIGTSEIIKIGIE